MTKGFSRLYAEALAEADAGKRREKMNRAYVAHALEFQAAPRKLYDWSPDQFTFWVETFQACGKDWLDELPPLEEVRGKPSKVSTHTLAQLVAEYRCRPGSRIKFLEGQVGQRNCEPYSNFSWKSAETVERYLKAGEKRAKTDSEFARLVNRITMMLRGVEVLPTT
jgi:hypothetical protein